MGSGNYLLDLDLYYWLLDRAGFPDDTKNQVVIDQNRIKVHHSFALKLDNGVAIAALMNGIRKIVIKKSKKSFPLDAQLNYLKDQGTTQAK